MADLVITAANVVPVDDTENVITRDYKAGATITAGQAVYFDPADNKWKLADADSATALIRTVSGIALNGASNGQPLHVQTAGVINLGATLAVASIYTLSATAGGIAPHGDLATGRYTAIIGVALTAANLRMRLYVSGVAVP